MTVRERIEQEERERLAPYATLSSATLGRERPIDECSLRTAFQRDRDRIIHCKSFRRLKYKTQCFLPDGGDHYRTRLTHTLEVAQVARTLARALRLNEDLAEAIALGHDLGHTCFGHMGERTLNSLCPGGFRHNEQSRRVVEALERDGEGLNLCLEVRDGIEQHRSSGAPATVEGRVVSYADRIAYMSHDIDDAVRAGVLRGGDIPAPVRAALGETHGERIDAMIRDIVAESEGKEDIAMSPRVGEAFAELREFLFEQVYRRPAALEEESRADNVLRGLYEYFIAHPGLLPPGRPGEPDWMRCRDFAAGMTDRFALGAYEELFLPTAGRGDFFTRHFSGDKQESSGF